MQSFPKIWALGTKPVLNIFKGPVEITEKLDGSQFNFGKKDGELWFRSKGAQIYLDNVPDLFRPSVAHLQEREKYVLEGWSYHGEAFCRPRHNTLQYSRVPRGHLALFGISTPDVPYFDYASMKLHADALEVEQVKLVYEGEVDLGMDWFRQLIAVESQLGGALMEGVVVKNYVEKFIMGTKILPCFGKYVSEQFKEKHSEAWVTGKDRLQELLGAYRSEARWKKAIQHLDERGLLTSSPKDIGPLLKEIQTDLETEEGDDFAERVFNLYRKDWLRQSIRGFPEWYKLLLMEKSIANIESHEINSPKD